MAVSEAGRVVRVLIVDDHEVVRTGLERMLSKSAGLQVVGSASSGEEALELAHSLSLDVVLLDLSLPGMHGLEVISRLVQELENPPKIIVLTVHDDDDIVLGAVRGGADGYLLKDACRDEIVRVIHRVAEGGRHFDAVVVKALMQDEQRRKDCESLSDRELEILRMVAAGATNKEVGRQMYLSPDTVKSHLESAYRKLGVNDRAHAVAVAMRRGLLS